jgi:hypothetical protein
MSLNSKNREAYHAYDTKAALARLRSGGNRGAGDWDRTDRIARNHHLIAIAVGAGSETARPAAGF